MTPRKEPAPTLANLFDLAVSELDNSVRMPSIRNYGEKSYPEQERFHRSQALGRYLSGGNRGGKSDAEVVDALWTAMDTHPYRDRPEHWGTGAIQIRFVVVDISKGVEQIVLPKLKRWTTPSMLKGGSWDTAWNKQDMILTLSNGSTIDFVTWGMDLMKLGGVPRHAIYFDEEPPQNIFNECMSRLLDYRGFWVIAATPTMGIGWSYDLLWEPAQEHKDDPNWLVDTFTLSAAQNPYLAVTTDDMDFYMMGMDREERQIREHGSFVARSGLVFPQIAENQSKFVIAGGWRPPRGWKIYSSVDHGWKNATAWLWHAVSPSNQIVTFFEHYASLMTVSQHAQRVFEIERELGITVDQRTGDPAMKQTNGITGTSVIQAYAMAGLHISVEGIPRDIGIGVDRMQDYLRLREDGLPRWQFTEDCPNLIREIKKLHYASYSSDKQNYNTNAKEEIHAKDNHAPDSARYFITLMPDLTPDPRELTDFDRSASTISYQDLMAKLANDPSVTFTADHYDNSPPWETTDIGDEDYSYLGGY